MRHAIKVETQAPYRASSLAAAMWKLGYDDVEIDHNAGDISDTMVSIHAEGYAQRIKEFDESAFVTKIEMALIDRIYDWYGTFNAEAGAALKKAFINEEI